MRVEAVCTGDELLTGLTADTNTPFFAERLLAAGELLSAVQVVGDVHDEIVRALRAAAERADLVLVSGGLGPTADDLTAECAAAAAGVPLEESAQVVDHLKERFAKRGFQLTANNLRQARVPRGAAVHVADIGSAPMFSMRLGRATLCFVAGVPREYRHWVEAKVLPVVSTMRAQSEGRTYRALRLLRTVGLPESHLDARVAPLAQKHPDVVFGFRTQAPENHLKLLAQGISQAAADAALAASETDARALLGAHVFGVDHETFGECVGRQLVARGETVAVAESCTGGEVSALLSGPPGASAWFLGGFAAYANEMKERWVQVPKALLAQHGAVSASVAEALASGARAAAGSTWAISVTGIAGPTGGSEEKPVGLVYLGLAGPFGVRSTRHLYPGDRALVRRFAAYGALDLLRRALLEEPA